jgi:hypothetical protein
MQQEGNKEEAGQKRVIRISAISTNAKMKEKYWWNIQHASE